LADGLVRRYDTADTRDGLPPGEGVFLACSFWLADSLLATGRREEAQQLFERLLVIRNDVGLLSEEYDPQTNRLVGNFPQALSHACQHGSQSHTFGEAGAAKIRTCSHEQSIGLTACNSSIGPASDTQEPQPNR
jgi:hypothetical protein